MSRKITLDAVEAFESSVSFNRQNMQVEVLPNVTILKLFNNPIAYQYNDPQRTLSITNCGWATNTTKERLNGLKNVNIQQTKGIWFLNGKEWDGELIDVN